MVPVGGARRRLCRSFLAGVDGGSESYPQRQFAGPDEPICFLLLGADRPVAAKVVGPRESHPFCAICY